MAGRALAARIAVWYLPAAGEKSSYLSRAGAILRRAALFRPGLVGPWLYVVILLVVLPGLVGSVVMAYRVPCCLAAAARR